MKQIYKSQYSIEIYENKIISRNQHYTRNIVVFYVHVTDYFVLYADGRIGNSSKKEIPKRIPANNRILWYS